MLTQLELLRTITLGHRVAEDEADELATYFVETDQWRRIYRGEVDIVFGGKGAGKSAIYSSLIHRKDDLRNQNVILASAENPKGSLAFQDLSLDPPTSEREFTSLWKLYILALIARSLKSEGIENDASRELNQKLESAGILFTPSTRLKGILNKVQAFVRNNLRPTSVEPTVILPDASSYSVKIVFDEPTPQQRAHGVLSIDDLFEVANKAFGTTSKIWLLFDRLDVAFAETRTLEENALRALFKVYLDLHQFDAIKLKVFLRSDIWREITKRGFREASHITRTTTIEWNEAALLNLIVRRLLRNEALREYADVVEASVLSNAQKQLAFFYSLVPNQVDLGRNPQTFKWMLSRVQDGSKLAMPRELIHLMDAARMQQIAMLERGESGLEENKIYSRQALREALPEISKTRLEQTLYAEYPEYKEALQQLDQEETSQTPQTLANIWGISDSAALIQAIGLVEIGFFERRGEKANPLFWVPFLYRPALHMRQKAAQS